MELIKALRIKDNNKIAFVGAGGKSTAIFHLAREYSQPVIVTASTHLSLDQSMLADMHVMINSIEDLIRLKDLNFSGITLITGPVKQNRTSGLPLEMLSGLNKYCSRWKIPILIEADGSKRTPLKAPAAHEPPIPEFVDTVIVVAGLSALGKKLSSKWIHRPERFSEISNVKIGSLITQDLVVHVLNHKAGGLKNIPLGVRRIVLLNQADTSDIREQAKQMTGPLLSNFDSVVISSLKPKKSKTEFRENSQIRHRTTENGQVFSVHERIAGVILAAGEASRFGEPKQLLNWRGKPLVWHAASRAINAGLSPVVVVTGVYVKEIGEALSDLEVKVIYNQDWNKGQGTSVKAGVLGLPKNCGAVLFFLADQPLIPEDLITCLVKTHSSSLAPIVAPWVNDRFANPVLFDRELFSELAALSGEIGGKSLFPHYDIVKVFWKDPSILFDVDILEDYEQLLRRNNFNTKF